MADHTGFPACPKFEVVWGSARGEILSTAPERNSIVFGLGGDDTIFAESLEEGIGQHNIVFAGAGNDNVFSWRSDDLLFGNRGDDFLESSGGADTFIGGAGDDWLADYDEDPRYFGPQADPGDSFIFEKREGGFGNDGIHVFDYGVDRVVFLGYAESDLKEPPDIALTPTDIPGRYVGIGDFTFEDGSHVRVGGYSFDQDVAVGRDFIFTELG